MPPTATTIQAYDRQAPTETATATFGLGCFWGPDAAFGALDGVIRTRVGYAGGTQPAPSYEAIGDHTEVIQVEYAPEQVSFRTMLAQAFEQHSPQTQPAKRQYHHIIFTATDHQRTVLEAYLEDQPYSRAELSTRIEALDTFFLAEDYHQKYTLRGKRWLTAPFREAGYDDAAIRESPAAAKLNAQAAGHEITAPALTEAPQTGR